MYQKRSLFRSLALFAALGAVLRAVEDSPAGGVIPGTTDTPADTPPTTGDQAAAPVQTEGSGEDTAVPVVLPAYPTSDEPQAEDEHPAEGPLQRLEEFAERIGGDIKRELQKLADEIRSHL